MKASNVMVVLSGKKLLGLNWSNECYSEHERGSSRLKDILGIESMNKIGAFDAKELTVDNYYRVNFSRGAGGTDVIKLEEREGNLTLLVSPKLVVGHINMTYLMREAESMRRVFSAKLGGDYVRELLGAWDDSGFFLMADKDSPSAEYIREFHRALLAGEVLMSSHVLDITEGLTFAIESRFGRKERARVRDLPKHLQDRQKENLGRIASAS